MYIYLIYIGPTEFKDTWRIAEGTWDLGKEILSRLGKSIMTNLVSCVLCVFQKTIGNTNTTSIFTMSSSESTTASTTNSSIEYFAMPNKKWLRYFDPTEMKVLMLSSRMRRWSMLGWQRYLKVLTRCWLDITAMWTIWHRANFSPISDTITTRGRTRIWDMSLIIIWDMSFSRMLLPSDFGWNDLAVITSWASVITSWASVCM